MNESQFWTPELSELAASAGRGLSQTFNGVIRAI